MSERLALGDPLFWRRPLTDRMADFAAFNGEYRRHFDAARMPARSTVQAGLFPGVLVEIEVQAVVGSA